MMQQKLVSALLDKPDVLDSFKLNILEDLDRIERKCIKSNVPMSQITLVMRDPSKPKMFIVLSTETAEGLAIVAKLLDPKEVEKQYGEESIIQLK